MIKTSLCVSLVLALSGCGPKPPETKWCTDEEKRIERFDQCLKLLPSGPATTEYNDWSEVVETCDGISYSQAQVWRPEGCTEYLNAGANK